jgi:hypothetical protein
VTINAHKQESAKKRGDFVKVINYCFSCNKEHDVTGVDAMAKGLKCECGGYYITPSGKVQTKFIPETDEDYKLLGLKKMVKVWTIEHDCFSGGYTVDDPETLKEEFESELEGGESTYSKDDIEPFIQKLQTMQPGQSAELFPWIVSCSEMEEETINNLPEFTGW